MAAGLFTPLSVKQSLLSDLEFPQATEPLQKLNRGNQRPSAPSGRESETSTTAPATYKCSTYTYKCSRNVDRLGPSSSALEFTPNNSHQLCQGEIS